MSEQADRDALAEVIAGHREDYSEHCCYCHNGCGCGWDLKDDSANSAGYGQHAADAILASDWLAQRDRRMRAECLRDQADRIDRAHQQADEDGCTCYVVAGYLRASAARIEAGE